MEEERQLWRSDDLLLGQLALTLDRIDRYINIANIKASLVVTGAGLLLVFLGETRDSYLQLLPRPGLSWIAPLSFILTVSSLVLAAFYALKTLLSFLHSGERPGEYRSLIFFGSIADMSPEAYINKIQEFDRDSLVVDFARQIHLLSGAVRQKFQAANYSFLFLFLGISIPGLVLVVDGLSKFF